MSVSPRANRGPGAAGENRAALITAARSIFASHGFDAPLSSVAKQAGVGQGSLYRHFPSRYSLAVAVFQENMLQLEAIGETNPTLGALLAAVTAQAVESTAFFEMMGIERADAAADDLGERIRAVVSARLASAKADEGVPDWVTTEDVLLGIAMLAGALSKIEHDQRATVATRIWTLLPFGPPIPA